MDVSRARVGALRAAPARAGRGCSPRGKPRPGMRVFYGHDRVPGPGERAAGGTAKMQKLAERFPNSPTRLLAPLPRLDLAPARPRPAARPRAAARHPGRRQPGRRRLPGLGGRPRPRRSTGRCAGRSLAADHVLYQSEFCKRSADRVPRRAARRVGGPPQRGRRRATSRRPARRRPAARCCCSAATRRRRTGSSSALRTLAALAAAHPDARLLVTGRLVSPLEPLVDGARARASGSSSSASTRSATRRRSSAARTCFCTRRSTTPARRS